MSIIKIDIKETEQKEYELISKAIYTALKYKSIKTYAKTKDIRLNLIQVGYVTALEIAPKIKELSRDERFNMYCRKCGNEMTKYIYREIKRIQIRTTSTNAILKGYDDTTLEERLANNDKTDKALDLQYLIEKIKEILKKYSKEEKHIIIDYILLGYKSKSLQKEYLKEQKEIRKIVNIFKRDFFHILAKENYIYNNEKHIYINKSTRNGRKRQIICALIKDKKITNEELAQLLNMPLKKIIAKVEGLGNSTFKLYEIQKIRKKYFPNETLEVLAC